MVSKPLGTGSNLRGALVFPSADLWRKYQARVPRYTSYPTVPEWKTLNVELMHAALAKASTSIGVYVHIPFCESMCSYCGCNVIVSRDEGRKEKYVAALLRELDLVAEKLQTTTGVLPTMTQLHLGGGTPSSLGPELLDRLLSAIEKKFKPREELRFSCELAPHATEQRHIEVLAAHGCNRLSLGVQDLSPRVLDIVDRRSGRDDLFRVIAWADALGIKERSADMMVGLPGQKPQSSIAAVTDLVDLGITRVAVFNYAHVPQLKPHQKRLEKAGMPAPEERWAVENAIRGALEVAEFSAVGLDHYVRSTDALHDPAAVHRNFQGYTENTTADLIGLGVSSIGQVGQVYAQNYKRLSDYLAAVEAGRLPVDLGFLLSHEDQERRRLIVDLMCRLYIDSDDYDVPLDFASKELEALHGMQADGFLVTDGTQLRVQPLGRYFLRQIAACFDTYYVAKGSGGRFSSAG